MRNISLIIFLYLASYAMLSAKIVPQYGFENGIPDFISVRGHGEISLSGLRHKDGQHSACFRWDGNSSLSFSNADDLRKSMETAGGGIIVWIYSEKAFCPPLRFSFADNDNESICFFDFNMDFTGWRAAWIKWDDMHTSDGGYYGDIPRASRSADVSRMDIVPAEGSRGTIYIDRLSFICREMHRQITPDMQIPDNNCHLKRQMWHWARLWEWEQYPQQTAGEIYAAETEMVGIVEQRLDEQILREVPGAGKSARLLHTADSLYKKYGITRLADGSISGAPLLCDDEVDESAGEMRLNHISDMMWFYASDYLRNGNKSNVSKAIEVFDHAIDQGFAFGSGLGTNHHYGYQIRDIYKAAWILRDEFRKAGKADEYIRVLRYWSGIAEARLPFQYGRDELLDSWNTLTGPKVISIMLSEDCAEKYSMMKSLEEWLSASMSFSQGTLGGLKADGTSFHHGGHYPAYSTGAFAALGRYAELTAGTDFCMDAHARQNFKLALMTMRNYCNTVDWGIGISGRHPFGGHITPAVIEAFGTLALLGDLSGKGMEADPELGGAYLALLSPGGANSENRTAQRLREAGITALPAPEGFTVYNYGAFGIHRRDRWMITLKAYNSDVWSSEIYTHDNRFGRYQSYGSVQIAGCGEPVSAKASGFTQDGWDWNRMPGTTSVHLPYSLLDSPNKGTLMERNTSRFPGVSSLEGRNGCMAFTFTEKDRKNFCAGATAVKSVFCFDNRIIFIGSGITNSSSYPTETTLFQLELADRNEAVSINGREIHDFPFCEKVSGHRKTVLTDTKGNIYVLPDGNGLTVMKQTQSSPSDTGRKTGTGDFAAACIDHGCYPQDASYEYMILVSPVSAAESAAAGGSARKSAYKSGRQAVSLPYKVLCSGSNAHGVLDKVTGTEAYISYSGYSSDGDIAEISPETIVMRRKTGRASYIMSICTPDLGITDKGYTTPQESRPLARHIIIKGKYEIDGTAAATAEIIGRTTKITAACTDGQPVEFTARRK